MAQEKKSIYEVVNDIILSHLEKGVVPWRQTWIGKGIPRNRFTKRVYRGINHILLNLLPYPTNEFLSFKQVQELHGRIRKGENGHMVIFWKWIEPVQEEQVGIEQDTSKYPYIQYHRVWNIAQCEGISSLEEESEIKDVKPYDHIEALLASMDDKPKILNAERIAYYDPKTDLINVPSMQYFESSDAYYSVLFHELIHSTGHSKRLARKGVIETIRFGSMEYSFEELIAEMGACYLLSDCGIIPDNFSNNASYLQGWIKKLKSDKYSFIHATVQAQKALDYLHGVHSKAD